MWREVRDGKGFSVQHHLDVLTLLMKSRSRRSLRCKQGDARAAAQLYEPVCPRLAPWLTDAVHGADLAVPAEIAVVLPVRAFHR